MVSKIFNRISRFFVFLFLKRKMVKKLMAVTIEAPESKKRFSLMLMACQVLFIYRPLYTGIKMNSAAHAALKKSHKD
jgi:hypothetical protein